MQNSLFLKRRPPSPYDSRSNVGRTQPNLLAFSVNELHRNMMKIRVKKISQIFDMHFISIKSMKWQLGNMYQVSFENIKDFVKPRSPNQKPTNLFIFK